MLEGLNICEEKISKIQKNEITRLEPDFYTSKTIKFNSIIGKEIIDFVQYGTSKELNEEKKGYPILRLNEFESYFISNPSKYCNLINDDVYEELKLHKNDVLICRTNGNPKYVGKAALVPKNYEFAYASYLFKIRPKKELINSSTLVTFLNSNYGRLEIEKHSMVGNQANFSPAKFREINIPIFEKKFNEQIENLVFKSFNFLEKFQQTYQQAETLLLEELGLNEKGNGFESCSRSNYNIKSFSESFSKTGRIDAEYYQPKYEEYIFIIQNYKNGFEVLNSICNLKDQNYNPDYKNEYQYIELSNIGNSGDVNGCTKELGKDLPTRARRKVETNDIIVSSIEGSLQSCALIPEKYNNSLCSTGFYVINSDEINSETLLVLFKSEPLQNILKQNCSGTILTAINKPEFQNIPIPKIEKTTQEKIASLVQESFTLKKQSEELLELAKKAVEIAIEEGEEKGMEILEIK